MVDKNRAQKLIGTYGAAWANQDTNLALSVFSDTALFQECVLEPPLKGHEEIRTYWEQTVCKKQKNIRFELLNLFVDGDTAIAEWDVVFLDVPEEVHKHLKTLAVAEIRNDKIIALRGYAQREVLKIAALS